MRRIVICCRIHTGEYLFFVQGRLVYWIQQTAKSTGKLAIIVHTGKLAIIVHTGKLAIIVHIGKIRQVWVHIGKVRQVFQFISARFAKFWVNIGKIRQVWVNIGKIRQVLSSYRQVCQSLLIVNEPIFQARPECQRVFERPNLSQKNSGCPVGARQ